MSMSSDTVYLEYEVRDLDTPALMAAVCGMSIGAEVAELDTRIKISSVPYNSVRHLTIPRVMVNGYEDPPEPAVSDDLLVLCLDIPVNISTSSEVRYRLTYGGVVRSDLVRVSHNRIYLPAPMSECHPRTKVLKERSYVRSFAFNMTVIAVKETWDDRARRVFKPGQPDVDSCTVRNDAQRPG